MRHTWMLSKTSFHMMSTGDAIGESLPLAVDLRPLALGSPQVRQDGRLTRVFLRCGMHHIAIKIVCLTDNARCAHFYP